jgi:hypothetical protein
MRVNLLRHRAAVDHLTPEVTESQEFGRRNGVPGELVVRLQPTKVIAVFDMTG